MPCRITIDSNEGEFLSHILKHDEKKRLPVGDILIECGDTDWVFERKTWGDGLNMEVKATPRPNRSYD